MSSELNTLQQPIYRNMQWRETDELLEIWMKQDKEEWSNEAFEVVHNILLERLGSQQAIEEAINSKKDTEVKEQPVIIEPKPYIHKIPKLKVRFDDDKSSSKTLLPFNPWGFGVLWVLLHFIVLTLIGALVTPLLSMILMPSLPISIHPFEKWEYILIINSFITGLVIGGVEWYLLQRYFEWSKAWIVVTAIGFILSRVWLNFTLEWVHFLLGFISAEIGLVLINAAVSSVLIGVAQWFVLRGKIDNAYLWILASLAGGLAGVFVVELYFIGISDSVNPDRFEQGIIDVVSLVVDETIKVACLIWLLQLTLKQEKRGHLDYGVS